MARVVRARDKVPPCRGYGVEEREAGLDDGLDEVDAVGVCACDTQMVSEDWIGQDWMGGCEKCS
jgi:hypothetical protein